jgi:hypothetical protein
MTGGPQTDEGHQIWGPINPGPISVARDVLLVGDRTGIYRVRGLDACELVRTWRPVRELIAVGGRVYYLFDPPRSRGQTSDSSHVLVQSIAGGPPKLLMRRIAGAKQLHVAKDEAVYVYADGVWLRRDPESGEVAPVETPPPDALGVVRRAEYAVGDERYLCSEGKLWLRAASPPAPAPRRVWAEETNLTAFLWDLGGGRMRALFGESSKLGCTWFRREEGGARHVLACLPIHLMERAMKVLIEKGLLQP